VSAVESANTIMKSKNAQHHWEILLQKAELQFIDINYLQLQTPGSLNEENSVVKASIGEFGYDHSVMPLVVCRDGNEENRFTIIDGAKRFLAALETGILYLYCFVLPEIPRKKTLELSQSFNAAVLDFRSKKTVYEVIIQVADLYYKGKVLRINLPLPDSAYVLLEYLSGRSRKTIDRALRGLRMLLEKYLTENPTDCGLNVNEVFDLIIKSQEYPFIASFAGGKLKPKQFETECLKILKNDGISPPANAEKSLPPTPEEVRALTKANDLIILLYFLQIECRSYDREKSLAKIQTVVENFAASHPRLCELILMIADCLKSSAQRQTINTKGKSSTNKQLPAKPESQNEESQLNLF